MSIPESAPALEAFRLQLIKDLNVRFEQFVLALDPDFVASIGQAVKPSAPAKEIYTSSSQVRAVLIAKWFAIGKRLRKLNSFPLAVLRSEIEQHYIPHPADMQGGDLKHVKWHATVSNSVCSWPSDELGSPLVERVGNNQWRVTEYGRSIL
jgi:hypothetical protein